MRIHSSHSSNNLLELLKDFNDISALRVHDLFSAYRETFAKLNVEDIVDYEAIRDETFHGMFHMVTNVKISKASPFIPLAYITNRDEIIKNATIAFIIEINKNNRIRFNYTDFVESASSIYPDLELETISFSTSCIGDSITISKLRINDSIEPEVALLFNDNNADHFVNILAKEYHKINIDTLYYKIFVFDTDFLTGTKLTQFLMISEHEEEINAFFMGRIRRLRNLVSVIRTKYIYDIQNISRCEAVKSAISAIMSRNMSHNLGSHYLYYTKAQLDKLSSEVGEWGPKVRGASKVLGYVQARMDYLATVISNDKYPYGAVNFKSQIFDELTVDKFSKRHYEEEKKQLRTTNYLLANLIKSENFTVPDILDNATPEGFSRLDLCVKLYNSKTHSYDYFSGYDSPTWDETPIKNRLSNIYVALPGGIMSSHAFFNVIENFIRNSAKYLQSDFQANGLIFNLLLKPSKDYRFIDVIIYDNKQNANRIIGQYGEKSITLYQSILNKLASLKIINDANELEKDSKGFKEILFSSVWMKAYEFKERTYADIITEINSEDSGYSKLSLIEKYGFSLVKVYDPFNEFKDSDVIDDEILQFEKFVSGIDLQNNEDCKYQSTHEDDIVVLDRNDVILNGDKYERANLGLKLTLPLFNNMVSFDTIPSHVDGSLKKNIESMLAIYSDIVRVDKEYYKDENHISHCFTRPYSGIETKPVEVLKEILRARFPDFDKYQLVFDITAEYNRYDIPQKELLSMDDAAWRDYEEDRKSHRILFRRHLNTKEGVDFKSFIGYAYVDSVSGGNFTITINDLITQSICKDGYQDEDSEYFALKVKEAALTRITIIDERLFNSMVGHEAEYMMKNLRILNYNKLEDDISYAVNLIDDYVAGTLSFDEYKSELECKIWTIIETVARCSDSNQEAQQWHDRIVRSIDYNTLVVPQSIAIVKAYLSERIVDSICDITNYDISVLFDGNKFKDGYNFTHFLSIHLGLIEKIMKNSAIVNRIIDKRLQVADCSYRRLDHDRVVEFLKMISELFDNQDMYVSIHSGRGNFSKELEGPLAPYPFISLSALENAFNNSKYLLSQIFYNTIYIGKGLANS